MNLRPILGALIVPALAIAYALFAWWEQTEGAYREDTTQYMMVLIVPVLALAGIVILQSLFEGWRRARRRHLEAEPPDEADEADAAQAPPPDRGRFLRPALLIVAALLLVLAIDWLGYLIAFSLFVVSVLLAMGVRAPLRVAGIAVCTMVLVHVVFIEILDQPLPRGLLESLSP